MLAHTPDQLSQQLGKQRRTVDFDTFDIQLQQLLWMLAEGQVSVAPAYQRQFRWDETRCSELIESLILGIPVPNLFMATNDDNTWETVDGVQRLSAIVKFAGDENLRNDLSLGHALELSNLKKLSLFNGLRFNNLPTLIQQHVSSTLYKMRKYPGTSPLCCRMAVSTQTILQRGQRCPLQQTVAPCWRPFKVSSAHPLGAKSNAFSSELCWPTDDAP